MFAPPPVGDESFHDPIRLADWVELNLLTGQEPTISVTDITDELADNPPDDASDSERRFKGEEQTRPGYWEAAEENAEAAFGELFQRAEWLGRHYPLELDGDVATLRSALAARDVYRFLVLLRARQLYQDALGDDGEDAGALFEELVKHALGAYAGTDPEHRVRFGVAGGHRGDGLPDSFSEAVEELRLRLHEAKGVVPDSARGDYKADAFAWKPFDDERPGQLVMIGQSTISEGAWMREEPAKKWTDKQPPGNRLINFLARPVTVVAFVETLSLTRPDTIEGLGGTFSSIPFDRVRLLSVLSDEDLPNDLRDGINAWASDMSGRLLQ